MTRTRRATNEPASREARLIAEAATRFDVFASATVQRLILSRGIVAAVRFLIARAPLDEQATAAVDLRGRYLTSDDLYGELRRDADARLADLRSALDRHAARQARDPHNYGFAGDLGSVVARLDEALAAIGNTEEL